MRCVLSIVLCLSASSAVAFCGTGGGVLSECVTLANRLPRGHALSAGHYVSGGTLFLRNVGCISPEASFDFHSAWRQGPDGPVMEQEGNAKQRQMLSEHPQLVRYLDAVGAYASVNFTHLDAATIATLTHRPLCNEERNLIDEAFSRSAVVTLRDHGHRTAKAKGVPMEQPFRHHFKMAGRRYHQRHQSG